MKWIGRLTYFLFSNHILCLKADLNQTLAIQNCINRLAHTQKPYQSSQIRLKMEFKEEDTQHIDGEITRELKSGAVVYSTETLIWHIEKPRKESIEIREKGVVRRVTLSSGRVIEQKIDKQHIPHFRLFKQIFRIHDVRKDFHIVNCHYDNGFQMKLKPKNVPDLTSPIRDIQVRLNEKGLPQNVHLSFKDNLENTITFSKISFEKRSIFE